MITHTALIHLHFLWSHQVLAKTSIFAFSNSDNTASSCMKYRSFGEIDNRYRDMHLPPYIFREEKKGRGSSYIYSCLENKLCLHLYVGLLIPMRQLLEVSFSYLVMFAIVFRMFRLFSSSCHQLITTELHFTNKSWLEPTWLGYCCLREFEKMIISLSLEIDRHGPNHRQSHLFTPFLSWSKQLLFSWRSSPVIWKENTHTEYFCPQNAVHLSRHDFSS